MTANELIRHWSDQLLGRLLDYRQQHPEFTFALRQKNRYGRLDDGHWFQGDEQYIFLGMTARGDEDHKTRSVGLVFSELSEQGANCRVEVIFRTEPVADLVAMYRHIVEADPAYYKPNQPYYDGYKYCKDYGHGDPLVFLARFLSTDWPVFVQAANKRGVADLFLVSEPDFVKHLTRIQQLRGKELPTQIVNGSTGEEPETEIEDIDESSATDSTLNGADIKHPFDAAKIDIRFQPLSLDQIVKRLRKNQINIHPEYQRLPGLWSPQRMSQLIESLIIRLPLPVFYFDGSNDVWEVVDGLQRLSTLKNFMVEEGEKALRLTGLEYLREYNGFTFNQLPPFLQTRIEETQLLVYIINPGTPDEIKYNIFKRINTGGLILTPQEIRNALNQGLPAKTVNEMAGFQEFKQATHNKIPSDRMEDRDFVTRFIGFYDDYTLYQPDLDSWLNRGLAGLKKMSPQQLDVLKHDFKRAMNAMYDIFGEDAFRKRYNENDRKKPINKALFDTWSVNLAKRSDDELKVLVRRKKQLIKGFIALMNQTEFDIAVSRSTGDAVSVRRRFEKINELITTTLQ